MSLQPFNWSVVILGRWNLAILTPARISKKIFKLKPQTQVKVAVPIDGISPYLVEHPTQKIRVEIDVSRLVINLTQINYQALQDAMLAGVNALKWLPETPISAAGFNVNFQTKSPTPNMAKLYCNATFDNQLAELGHSITSWALTRSVSYNTGLLNIAVSGNPDYFELSCNFHRKSNENQDLIEWLEIAVSDVETQVTEVLKKLNLDLEEIKDEQKD